MVLEPGLRRGEFSLQRLDTSAAAPELATVMAAGDPCDSSAAGSADQHTQESQQIKWHVSKIGQWPKADCYWASVGDRKQY